MQLPHDLQRFPEPTLIVVADHVEADLWLAGGEGLEQLDGVALPKEQKSDREGSSVSTDTSRANAPEPKTEEARLHAFVHRLNERIVELLRGGTATRVYLAAPLDVANPLVDHLPGDLQPKIARQLPEQLRHEPILDVVRRFLPNAS